MVNQHRMHHPQPPMSDEERELAAQLAPYVQQTREHIAKAMDTIELRKWVVHEAAAFYPHFVVNEADRVGDLRTLLTELLEFASAPLKGVAADLARQR